MAFDDDRLAERLRAVERALVDGDPPETFTATAELTTRVEALEADLDEVTERLLTVEAVVQALQGYAGHVQHVNRTVERRANTALAAIETGGDRSTDPAGGAGGHSVPPDDADRRSSARARATEWDVEDR